MLTKCKVHKRWDSVAFEVSDAVLWSHAGRWGSGRVWGRTGGPAKARVLLAGTASLGPRLRTIGGGARSWLAFPGLLVSFLRRLAQPTYRLGQCGATPLGGAGYLWANWRLQAHLS